MHDGPLETDRRAGSPTPLVGLPALLVVLALAAVVAAVGDSVGLVLALPLLLGCFALSVLAVWAALGPARRSPVQQAAAAGVAAVSIVIQRVVAESASVLLPPLVFAAVAAARRRTLWWALTTALLTVLTLSASRTGDGRPRRGSGGPGVQRRRWAHRTVAAATGRAVGRTARSRAG